MRDTSSRSASSSRLISSNPELALWIVANGVLKACANPSRTVDRNCSLRLAASALLSAAKECALSRAIAEREAIASTDRGSKGRLWFGRCQSELQPGYLHSCG